MASLLIILGAAAVAAISLPVTIAVLGFGTGGVAAGSVAAGIQSGIGNVAAGSLFAALQSLGTVPLVTAGYSALVAGVCAVVAAVATIF